MLRPRPRTLLLLGLAAWILFSAGWLVQRWRALRILERQGDAISWIIPPWAQSIDRRWSRLLPVSRVYSLNLYLNTSLTNGAELAWAVRKCGPVKFIRWTAATATSESNFLPPDNRGALTCLRALGRQPAVTSLEIVSAPLSEEEINRLLEQLPGLSNLELTGVPYSGKNLPAFPDLERAAFNHTRFSDEGLAALLQRCPKLRAINLMNSTATPAALRQIPKHRAKALERFSFYAEFYYRTLSEAEARDLRQLLRQAWPTTKFEFVLETKEGALIIVGDPPVAPPK
jgi:hypothetical protein